MAAQNSNNDLTLLKNLVPLNTLSDAQLTQLQDQVAVEHAKKGEYLFREGDTDHHNIYLLAGSIALLSGRKQIDVVSSGTKTARFALAHQLPRQYSGRAKTAVSYVRIDSRLLSDLLARNQSASYEVNETGDSNKGDWMGQLLQSPIFQQIPPANLQRIMMSMSEMTVSANEVIIQEGDEGDYYYLISSGQCRVTRQSSPDQAPLELALLSTGQGFGEEALLSDKPRSSTVTMLTDGELMRLSKQDFVEFVKQPVSNQIEYARACQMVQQNGLWIDVRITEEYEAVHLPKAINLPFFSLRFQAPSLAEDHVYLVYGDDAGQTAIAAYLLMDRGYEVLVVKEEWREIVQQAGLQAAETAPLQDTSSELSTVEPEVNETEAVAIAPQSTLQAEQTDTNEDLIAKLARYQTEQKRLKQALAVAKRKLEQAEQTTSKQQNAQAQELGQLREKLTAAEADQAQYQALQEREHELKSQLDESKEKLNRSENELKQAQIDRARAQEEQARQAQEFVVLREKLELAQQESGALVRERQMLQETEEELLGQIEALKGQKAAGIAELEEQRKSLELALAASKAEIQTVRGTLQDHQDELKALEEQRSTLQAQFEQEHQTAEFLRRSFETAENAVEISDAMVEENNQEITRLNQQLHDLQSELADAQAATSEMAQGHQTVVQELNDEIIRLQQEHEVSLVEQGEERERLQAEKTSLEKELAQVQGTLQANQQAHDRATAEQQLRIEQLENELVAARTEAEGSAQIQAELREQEMALQQAQQEISRLTKTIEGLQEVQMEMESQLSEDSADELNRLRAELESAENKRRHAEELARQADVLRRERAVQDTAVEMLGEDIENLTRENARLSQAKQVLEQEVKELRKHQSSMDGQSKADERVDEWRIRADEFEQQRDRAHAEVDRLKTELHELRSSMDAQMTAPQVDGANDANAEARALRTELEMVRKTAEAELAQMRNQLAAADATDRQQGSRDVDTVATVQALRQEIDSIRRALSDKEQTLRVSQSQCRSLEDAIEDRDKENDQLRRKLESVLRKTSGLAVNSEMLVTQFQDPSTKTQGESEQVTLQLNEQLTKGGQEAQRDNQRNPFSEMFRKR
jgi:CRP-like cAMP-binding protein/DNA repair exonuclease SbcCD ATPase subunit